MLACNCKSRSCAPRRSTETWRAVRKHTQSRSTGRLYCSQQAYGNPQQVRMGVVNAMKICNSLMHDEPIQSVRHAWHGSALHVTFYAFEALWNCVQCYVDWSMFALQVITFKLRDGRLSCSDPRAWSWWWHCVFMFAPIWSPLALSPKNTQASGCLLLRHVYRHGS